MSDVAIRVENLGKRYRIGERERYLALRDVVTRAVSASARIFGPHKPTSSNGNHSHIWALRNVSFDIRRGEVVGIIGRNGAGKTTLLKILARVTKPTQGFAEVRGRMGTLLEVGTGFHPELTGRENVFLSGAILGMSKSEIRRKFDEIVAFAEVEKFIDTPLKHYSTGMQMRLAFAVAAHLEPEILLVDEVLAVGDLEFQKKCLGKMGDVAKAGRTILFVSHQMNQIRRLCPRVVWLHGGGIRQDGPTEQVLAAYEGATTFAVTTLQHGQGHSASGFVEWEIVKPRGAQRNSIAEGSGPILMRVRFKSAREIQYGIVTALIYDTDRRLLAGWAFEKVHLRTGEYDFLIRLGALPLRPGAYDFLIKIASESVQELWNLTPPLVVEGKPMTHFMDEWAGFLNVPCGFSVVPFNSEVTQTISARCDCLPAPPGVVASEG